MIADDVGVGKTIEAGLVLQELLLRHRARTILIVCPATLQIKWQQAMAEKFGLEFRIPDSDTVREIRRTRGIRTNPFSHYPRLIVSIDWLKHPRADVEDRRLAPAGLDDLPAPVRPVADRRGSYVRALRPGTLRDGLAAHPVHSLAGPALRAPPLPLCNSAQRLHGVLHRAAGAARPQRFARGVEPSPAALAYSVVRRLKLELCEAYQAEPTGDPCDLSTDFGSVRFPFRCVQELEVEYPEEERNAHRLLTRYAELRRKQGSAAHQKSCEAAADFVTLLMKKRLFSSPAAFAGTLAVHQQTLAAKAALQDVPQSAGARSVQTAFEKLDEEVDDEQVLERATPDALAAATAPGDVLTDEQLEILEQLTA